MKAARTSLALLGVHAAVLLLAGPVHASFPGEIGKVAFHSNRDGNFEIYTVDADGGNDTRLTTNPADDLSPAWSPDGTKIAFTSDRDGQYDIYTMNADGSGQTRITNNPAADVTAAWSPDGTKIVFGSLRDGNGEIYTMNSNGTGVTRITTNAAVDGQASLVARRHEDRVHHQQERPLRHLFDEPGRDEPDPAHHHGRR